MLPDPRTALLFGVAGTASALSGVAAATGVLLLSLGLAAAMRLEGRRFLPLAGSVGAFALLIPFAPGPAAAVLVKGLAVSFVVLVSVAAARWDRLLATLQGAGLGRTPIAFLAIVLSHLEASGHDASRAVDGLVLRGGFRGARGILESTPLVLARTLRRALERADRTAEALELRGFVGRVPALPPFRVRAADLAGAAAAVLVLAFAVLSRVPWNR